MGRIGPKISSCVTVISDVACSITCGERRRLSAGRSPAVVIVAPLPRASAGRDGARYQSLPSATISRVRFKVDSKALLYPASSLSNCACSRCSSGPFGSFPRRPV